MSVDLQKRAKSIAVHRLAATNSIDRRLDMKEDLIFLDSVATYGREHLIKTSV